MDQVSIGASCDANDRDAPSPDMLLIYPFLVCCAQSPETSLSALRARNAPDALPHPLLSEREWQGQMYIEREQVVSVAEEEEEEEEGRNATN